MKSYRILIVEDEIIPAHYIKKILEQNGHIVVGISDSKESALNYLHSKKLPELILMDIKIKGDEDGIEVAKAFLGQTQVAIIYLSAYMDENFLNRAKETEPIGYLVKPVQPNSLLSTIAIGMENFFKEHITEKFELSAIAIFDPKAQILINDEETITLSKFESLLLSTLIKSPNRLIPYATLENSTWRGEQPSDGALRTTIWRLRKKLPDTVKIENLYSSGYKISF